MSQQFHFASQHTTSLPAFLNRLGISIAVSTYQAGQLILLREREGVLNTHFVGFEKPMGMTADGRRLVLGTPGLIWDLRNIPAVAAKVEPTGAHDACYLPRQVNVTGEIDIHEMAHDRDDVLWFVNTRMSCLCTFDPDYSVVPRWRPPFVSGYDLTDRCHLNGLAMRDGRPTYVTALGKSDRPAGWRPEKAHGGLLMTVADRRILAEGLSMPHSPRWFNDRLWFLESGAGTLASLDPETGEKQVVCELPGFTRGLEFIGPYAIIGLSQVRETAIFAGLPLTEREDRRHCGVWVVEWATGRTVAYATFTGSVQEIFSVAVLPWRQPEVTDLANPLVRSSYSLPDEALKEVASVTPFQEAISRCEEKRKNGELEEALDAAREAVRLDPADPGARYRLGSLSRATGRHAEAIETLSALLRHDPRHADAAHELGLALTHEGKDAEALAAFEQAIGIDRQYVDAHLGRAFVCLRQGRYAEGWRELAFRLESPAYVSLRTDKSRWDGRARPDAHLLVIAEGSDAEVLLFARFLALAARRRGRVTLATEARLHPLLEGMAGIDTLITPSQMATVEHDDYCHLQSLPGLLECNDDAALAEALELAGAPLARQPPRSASPRRIGLIWRGDDPDETGDRLRAALEPVVRRHAGRFVSLQHGIRPEERDWLKACAIPDLGGHATSREEIADRLDEIDLLITIDTPIAHVAGIRHVPLGILLTDPAAWYWQRARRDSPCYPGATLYRLPPDGNWAAALEPLDRHLCGHG